VNHEEETKEFTQSRKGAKLFFFLKEGLFLTNLASLREILRGFAVIFLLKDLLGLVLVFRMTIVINLAGLHLT
jgi:hypothetical protein